MALARLQRLAGDAEGALSRACGAREALQTIGDTVDLLVCLTELGHIGLARGERDSSDASAMLRRLEEATKAARAGAVLPFAEPPGV